MSEEPTRADGRTEPDRTSTGRDLVLARDAGSPARPKALPGKSRDETSVQRADQLADAIRALGVTSLGLGVVSAVFIWPRVRLIYLAAILLLAVAAAVAGLALRVNYHAAVRRLPRDPRAHRGLRRTKAHRCHVGLALAVLMFGSGLLIRQAEIASAARPSSEPSEARSRRGFDRVRASALRPGQWFVLDDESLRVESAALVERPLGLALVLTLEFRNTSSTRKISLDRVRDVELPLMRASLYDNLSNGYDSLESPTIVDGGPSGPRTAIYPGGSMRARIAFEPPVKRARTLLLGIPSTSFGLSEDVKFELDTSRLGTTADTSLHDAPPIR